MSRKIEQYSRLLHHRLTGSGEQFTVPTSNDHTDETWSKTDLYIGELGINVTDDTIFMRTNNGIVQIATGTSSGTASVDTWNFTGTEVEINNANTAVAVIRNANSFTDLGSSSLRWKDLYLGGSTGGWTTINVNSGFSIRDSDNFLITQLEGGTHRAPIILSASASNGGKEIPIHINSTSTEIEGGVGNTIISSIDSVIGDCDNVAIISGKNVHIEDDVENAVFIGDGKLRPYYLSNSLGVGGKLAIRGVIDDGTGNYDESDWIKGQRRVTTTNANETDIFTHEWDGNWGEVIQIRAMVMGIDVSDPENVYSTEILITGSWGPSNGRLIGNPIIKEVSTFSDVYVNGYADDNEISIKVKGLGSTTIQWLCSYEYHRIINID